jgi:peptidoglycan glycosyltransferase
VHRTRIATRSVAFVIVGLVLLAVIQAAAVGVADPAGWRRSSRNARTNGWGATGERALLAADGSTPLESIVAAPTMVTVRQLLGTSDDLALGHGWFTRGPSAHPLVTSIEPEIQAATAEALAGQPAAAVVVDVATGQILALAGGLEVGPDTAAPPGSIFKPVLYGAALDAGLVAADSSFPVERSFAGVSNFGGSRCGGDTIEVLAQSCNAAAERIGRKLGADRLEAAAASWGFVAPADITGFAPAFPARNVLDDPSAFTSAVIGQHDTRVTPVWAAEMVAAVGNGGTLRTATVLPADAAGTQVMETGSAATLRTAMRRAVTHGTASAAAQPNVAVAAKTGTAQTGRGYDHAWTVAFAPADRPQVAVAVLVLGAPGRSRVGGHDAAPIAGEILAAACCTDGRKAAQ